MARVLIVDDEKNIRINLSRFVRDLGHDVESAGDASEALQHAERHPFDIVFTDVRMPGADGLELLQQLRLHHPQMIVVLMTAYATVPQAVEAMRAGAYDYLVKPFALDQVRAVLQRGCEVQALRRENAALRQAMGEGAVLLDSKSAEMQRALQTAERAAASDATVLLTGESGTGKNVLARAIHQWSPRCGAPLVTIQCTTLSDNLVESELFGHVKGAFTGAWKDKPGRLEAARGGTVFLDEVGELPLDAQAKLLRVIEEHVFERVGGEETIRVDARVVAATNRDLEKEAQAQRFRQDLYFRLNVIGIRLPPLRERMVDLPDLAKHLLAGLAAKHRRPGALLSEEAAQALAAYHWPGNIRELVNVLERAVVLASSETIAVDDLPDHLLAPPDRSRPAEPRRGASLEDIERDHIERVLAECATLDEAAVRLGINATTLWRKRKRYGID